MNLHEYQARTLLKAAGVPMLDGDVASTPPEAEAIARRIGGTVVVKAQVHAGGRGKAGGVKLARHAGRGRGAAERDPRHEDQGPDGGEGARGAGRRHRHRGLRRPHRGPRDAAPGVHGERRRRHRHRGGRGQDAGEDPRLPVDPATASCRTRRSRSRFFLYQDFAQVRAAAKIMQQLYTVFIAQRLLARRDQSARHDAGRARCSRSTPRWSIDDNELDRRPDLAALRDESAEEPSEVAARRANLTFIKLDGNVGCVVNGAGLAMATMDLVKYYGGEPANFLDIGGSSNPEKVVNALTHHHRRSRT